MLKIVIFLLVASLAAAEEYKLAASWGERGQGPGQFLGAHGIAIDRADNVIVVDSRKSCVYRFTPTGKFLGEIGSGRGSGPGQFYDPRDAVVSPSGQVLVADGHNHCIQVFDGSGKFIRKFGTEGKGPGEFLRTHALDLDSIGRLFVSDVDNSRIDVYDAKLNYVTAWGKAGTEPGDFHAPHGIGVDRQGNIIVCNYYSPVQKFTPQGKFLMEFARMTPEDGLLSYHSMCIDRAGNVYVTTRYKERDPDTKANLTAIFKYDSNGKLVARMNLPKGHFVEDVAVDSIGRVFATHMNRVATGVHMFVKN